MNWVESHRQSEQFAVAAHEALRRGDNNLAVSLFGEAAEQEAIAFSALSEDKPRTLGITAISATALWYKARCFSKAEQFAHKALSMQSLPPFAQIELRGLLQAIWNEKAQEDAGIAFAPGQVVVSVRGGEVVTGGAPLDLILGRVQIVQNLFYRTAEFLKSVPLRIKGPPSKEIQEKYRPWLFQSVPGSYQFIVAVQRPQQHEMFSTDDPEPEILTETFLSILRGAANESAEVLESVVPSSDYRKTFLKLTRNLAPTGKSFKELEIRGTTEATSVLLSASSRKQISDTLRPVAASNGKVGEQETTIRGTLRALHLENDWLEVIVDGQNIRVSGVGETVDDLIGPMVNQQVVVRAKSGKGDKLSFIDIEQDE